MTMVRTKRVYNPKENEDGFRILVDRLWPRGIKKESADFDEWLKDIAPSNELRKWFNHDVEKWADFKHKFTIELNQSPALEKLLEMARKHTVITLVYGAKGENHNQAIVIKEFVENKLKK